MGEATYYCKIRYNSDKERDKGYEFVKRFFYEGAKAEHYWQYNRGEDAEGFWRGFDKEFPLVKEYLEKLVKPSDHNKELAAFLNFGCVDDLDDSFQFIDNEIWYEACVWHLSKWDSMLAFVDEKTGSNSSWISDEYLDPFSSF